MQHTIQQDQTMQMRAKKHPLRQLTELSIRSGGNEQAGGTGKEEQLITV